MMRRTMALIALAATLLPACGRSVGFSSGPIPEPTPSPELEFVFAGQARYPQGFPPGYPLKVGIRNLGSRTFQYNATGYQACDFRYGDASGREFSIPEGTHCDLVEPADLEPGETATLFTWHLEECLVVNWGCSEKEMLPAGTYAISGKLRATEGPPARVSGTIMIEAETQRVIID